VTGRKLKVPKTEIQVKAFQKDPTAQGQESALLRDQNEQHGRRVARFFLVQHTKRKKLPKDN
jgi:hypothetical protein